MNDVAIKKEGALAANLFEADANKGAQNISQEDLALPFLKVSTSYRATITEANKEAAFNWLRNNGLGDIIKNEISVSFGRNEDTRAADYADLAKSHGFQPTQKLKVEPMTLKALVRERIEAGKEMPTEIFNVFIGNKTTIKRKQ